MKKWLWFALLLIPLMAFAADVKITDMTATTSPASTDIMPIVVDPGGSPANRKVTVGNLYKGILPSRMYIS